MIMEIIKSLRSRIGDRMDQSETDPRRSRFYTPLIHLALKIIWLKHRVRGYHLESPFALLWIPPGNIEYFITEEELDGKLPLFGIKGGDWDRESKRFWDRPFYRMVYRYLADGVSKEEIFERFRDKLNKSWSEKRINSSLKRWKRLYDKIKDEGYKTQFELWKEGSGFIVSPNVGNEINVLVGRDGKFICKDSKHRTLIAKALNLDLVPVYVRIRHRKWQGLREKLIENPNLKGGLNEKLRSHPDLQNILSE